MLFPRSVQSFIWSYTVWSKCRETNKLSTKNIPASLNTHVWISFSITPHFWHTFVFGLQKNPNQILLMLTFWTHLHKLERRNTSVFTMLPIGNNSQKSGMAPHNKHWRHWSSLVSSASPPLFVPEPSTASQKGQQDSHSAAQTTATFRSAAATSSASSIECSQDLQYPWGEARPPVGTVPPGQHVSYKTWTQKHWQCTTADTWATSEHYMAQQSQKLLLVRILDAAVSLLDAGTHHCKWCYSATWMC